MTTAEEYLRASDSSNDYADKLIDDLHQKALEDIDELFNNEDSRDQDVWDRFDAPDLSIKDFDSVDDEERDLDWVEGIAGISAAATTLFFLRNREETLIKPLAYREQVVGGLSIPRTELLKASKRGFNIPGAADFVALKAERLRELEYIKAMSDVELYDVLVDLRAMRPAEKVIADSVGYVSRMTSYRPGSPQFKEAVANLVNTDSTRALKGMNRRSVESMYSYREAGGKMDTLMVWVVEFSPRTCSYCQALAGTVATYQEFIENIGQPGSDVCQGGDLCNCHLEAI